MATEIAHQLAILQRIAAFSAAVRGHELGEWQVGADFAMATCIQCGASLKVYAPVFQPEMHGTARDRSCHPQAIAGRAA